MTTPNPYEMALAQYDRAVKHLSLKRGIEEYLRAPRRDLTVNFPVKMDDRGGAKGGVVCDPKQLSLQELENLTRRYATEISVLMSPEGEIPAPDVNTTPQIMAWIMDTYSMHRGYSVPAVVTGKPVHVGGSLGRAEATGRGVLVATREALARLNLPITDARVAVQGFGNVGHVSAIGSGRGSSLRGPTAPPLPRPT